MVFRRSQIQPDERIHGVIEDGGKVPNVIPDYSFTLFQPQTAAGGRASRSLKDVVVVIHPTHIKDLLPLSEIREVSPGNEVEWEGAA